MSPISNSLKLFASWINVSGFLFMILLSINAFPFASPKLFTIPKKYGPIDPKAAFNSYSLL